jgi:hypothetical protein
MWTIIFIILTVGLGLFLYIKLTTNLDNKNYEKKYADIFDAHKAIGYPKLTNDQQFDILDNENTGYLSTLTKFEFVPTGLLDHYINIDPDNYYMHLKLQDLQTKMRFDPNNLIDGFFINHSDMLYEYIFVERQHIEFKKSFDSYDKLLKYLVYDRLKLYAPEKYKYLDKKYYA